MNRRAVDEQARASFWRAIGQAPYRQDFYALLRRIENLWRDRPRLGRALRPLDEPVRVAQDAELDFAPAPVSSLVKGERAVAPRLGVRMFGLFAFFYATLHLSTWIVFVNYFDVPSMIVDIGKRPFITVGMATFVILFLLALTSNRFALRKLGRRWQKLHRLVYVAGILAVVHFWWLVKADITEPRRWAVAIGSLLLFRVWWANRDRLSLRS